MRRSRGTTPPPTPEKQPDNVKSFTPLIQQRQRRHYTVLAVLILCIAAAVFVFTGAMSASIALLGDAADSLSLYFNRSDGGWPVNTGISEPIQIAELAGGFVELDSEDVVVYSAYGAKVRSFQPGYARPVMAVGGTHFVVYNRAGSDLQVSSRTKALYTKTFDNSILLCAMSNNNTLAVVTESGRYAAQLQIFDPSFRQTYSWEMTQNEGTPIAVDFSPDNRQFAAGAAGPAGVQGVFYEHLLQLRRPGLHRQPGQHAPLAGLAKREPGGGGVRYLHRGAGPPHGHRDRPL